jgi:CheY-like chemotaxis protein
MNQDGTETPGGIEHPHERHAVELLLIEDNPYDAELTMRALRGHKIANRIQWVKDGAEALDVLFLPSAAPAPRLILLDLKLPKVDGHEVLARIKADPRTRTIPVIVLTSSAEEIDVVRSYDLGVNSYVVKPVAFESFADVVRLLGIYWLLVNTPVDRPGL